MTQWTGSARCQSLPAADTVNCSLLTCQRTGNYGQPPVRSGISSLLGGSLWPPPERRVYRIIYNGTDVFCTSSDQEISEIERRPPPTTVEVGCTGCGMTVTRDCPPDHPPTVRCGFAPTAEEEAWWDHKKSQGDRNSRPPPGELRNCSGMNWGERPRSEVESLSTEYFNLIRTLDHNREVYDPSFGSIEGSGTSPGPQGSNAGEGGVVAL